MHVDLLAGAEIDLYYFLMMLVACTLGGKSMILT